MSYTKENKKKRHPVQAVTVLCMLVLILAAGAFAWYQMDRYETGILEVCADQQDAYVQLVLDQINLKENRGDEAIITEILGTLDASSNKYWTFSKDQDMLLVKDVTETNKYKGFTTATYYTSDSARQFLQNLQVDQVTHQLITIDTKSYIASGVSFEYGKHAYRLCLLTNRDVLLDNNSFLGAKTEFATLLGILLILFLLIPMGFARWVKRLQRKNDELNEMISILNSSVTKLNERLENEDLYDARSHLWKKKALSEFVKKLQSREVSPIVLAEVEFKTEEDRSRFLSRARILLDRSVLRFGGKDGSIVLLFLQYDMESAMSLIRPLIVGETTLKHFYLLSAGNDLMKKPDECEVQRCQ
jgi:hypothetical protein